MKKTAGKKVAGKKSTVKEVAAKKVLNKTKSKKKSSVPLDIKEAIDAIENIPVKSSREPVETKELTKKFDRDATNEVDTLTKGWKITKDKRASKVELQSKKPIKELTEDKIEVKIETKTDDSVSDVSESSVRRERRNLFGIFARLLARPSAEEREFMVRKTEAENQRKLIEARVAATEKERKREEAARVDEETDPRLRIKRKKVRKRRSVKQLLALAGVEEEPIIIYRKIFNAAIGVVLALTALAIIMGAFYGQTFQSSSRIWSFLGFAAALWTAGLLAIFILFGLFYAVYLDLRINNRRKEIEAVFPDYLQLAAANLSAGMTIDRALWSAVRPRFGILAKEMEDVAKKTMTGYDLERALQEFSEKYDSLVIKRSVDLVCEGIRSGGRLADILNRIAINIQENEILQKEMAANVTTYVIFISFASVLAAPFLFGLATQLLIVIQHIAGNIALSTPSGGGGGGLSISANAVSLDDFKIFSMTILGVSSTMSACIVSVIRKGTVKDGLRMIPFFFVISLALYYLSIWALGFMFSRFLV